MSNINVRDYLNKLDSKTDNKYDLLNLYESHNLSDSQKISLIEMINKKSSAKSLNRFLELCADKEQKKYLHALNKEIKDLHAERAKATTYDEYDKADLEIARKAKMYFDNGGGSELDEDLEDDLPSSAEEIEKDLKSITKDFTEDSGVVKCAFEEESDIGYDILKQHYRTVKTSKDGKDFRLEYSQPINRAENKSLKENNEQETNDTDALIKEFSQYMRDNNFDYTAYPTFNDGEFQVDITWGDWKHDHIYLQHLATEFFSKKGISIEHMQETTEEDGSDTYSATHTFKITGENKTVIWVKAKGEETYIPFKEINGNATYNDYVEIEDAFRAETGKEAEGISMLPKGMNPDGIIELPLHENNIEMDLEEPHDEENISVTEDISYEPRADFVYYEDMLAGFIDNMPEDEIDKELRLHTKFARALGVTSKYMKDIVIYVNPDSDFEPDWLEYDEKQSIKGSNANIYIVGGVKVIEEHANGNVYLWFANEIWAQKYMDKVKETLDSDSSMVESFDEGDRVKKFEARIHAVKTLDELDELETEIKSNPILDADDEYNLRFVLRDKYRELSERKSDF